MKREGSSTLYININTETLNEYDQEAKKHRLTRSSFFEVVWKFYRENNIRKINIDY